MIKSAFIFCISFQMALLVHAQEVNVKIIEGFNTGNASQIYAFLADHVELIDPLNEGLFTSDFTQKRLQEFFDQNKTQQFAVKHKGNSPGGLSYCIGILKTGNGNFRVYLLFEDLTGSKILEIRIEEDE